MMLKFVDSFWSWLKIILLAVVLVLFIRGFIFIPLEVEGNSMENTLQQSDHLVMEKFSKIERFDLIVFQLKDGSTYIKRVVGLPGEKISYKKDKLYINGKQVAENFLTQAIANQKKGLQYTSDFDLQDFQNGDKLGNNEYFVMGDNRKVSKDSRSFGPITEKEILGKARMIYYPISHFKIIKSQNSEKEVNK